MAVNAKASKVKASSTTDDEDASIPEQEKTAVKTLMTRIDRAKALRKDFDTELLPKLRRRVWGTAKDDKEQEVRTNLIFATIATLLPHTYAKNPEIAVAPTEAVGNKQYEEMKKFCQTAQVMLNNVFVEEGKLKARMKSAVRSAMTTSVGWIKMTFQESLQGDPIQVRRANDMQDNLAAIERLMMAKDKAVDLDEQNRIREELKLQLKGVMDSPEVRIFKGINIDRVTTENMFILDESVKDFDDYAVAGELAHRLVMTDDDYANKFGKPVSKGATLYDDSATLTESGESPNLSDELKLRKRVVWEVWNKTTNMITTVCEGEKGYVKAPYVLKPASERWYSFFCIGFNLVEGRWRPLSDVELLTKLQDEYNTTRYLFAETRKEAIPVRVFRKAGGLTPEDIDNLNNRKTRDFIGVEGSPTVPIKDEIAQLDGPVIDPAAYDVTLIRNDMDMLVGLSDASRANLIEAKTATEAEIMRQALQTRVAERQDHVEDVISEMARAALEIMLQKFKLDEVKQIAGEGAVWPDMPVDQLFQLVRVSVRAGSSGKPNILKERESWATIMPIINDTITQVMELRMNGQDDLAQSKIELLKETLLRHDEKLDVDRFIPKQELGADGKPVAQANMMAKAAQMQEQMQLMQEEMQKLQEENQKLTADLQKAQLQEQAKIADAQRAQAEEQSNAAVQAEEQRTAAAQADADAAKAQADAAVKAAQERAKVEQARIDAQAKADEAVRVAADKLAFEERQAELDRANQVRLEIIKGIITAMKPQPTKGEDGKPGKTPEPDIDAMLAAVSKVANIDLSSVGAAASGEPSAADKREERLMATLEMIAKHMTSPRSVRVTKGANGETIGTTIPSTMN